MSFASASAIQPLGEGTYRVEVDPSWFQGQGAYGGITAAWLLRGMTAAVGGPDRLPRELSGSFCAKVRAGEARLRARVVRAGLNVSFATAELLQRGKVVATGSAVFSKTRADGLDYADVSMPQAPPPDACPAWSLPGGRPDYADHFDIRHALGVQPLHGELGDRCAVWVRPQAPEPVDAPLAAALLDCFAPAFFTRQHHRRPAGTVAWSVHFLADLPRTSARPEAYHLLDVRSSIAAGGYSSEDDALWSPDGVLIARARQLVVAL